MSCVSVFRGIKVLKKIGNPRSKCSRIAKIAAMGQKDDFQVKRHRLAYTPSLIISITVSHVLGSGLGCLNRLFQQICRGVFLH